MEQRYRYDYLVINRQNHLQEAVEQLRAIMLAEHARTQIRQIDI
jgi:guanylate kinase